jgi:hypothetical protein
MVGCHLDPRTGNLSQYAIPALVPDPSPTSYAAFLPAPPPSGTIPVSGATPQPGTVEMTLLPNQSWYMSHQGYAAEVAFVQSNVGGIAHILVDNQPLASFSTYSSQAQPYRLYNLGMVPQKVTVQNLGEAVLGAQLIGPWDNTSNGLSASVTLQLNSQPVTGGTYNFTGQVAGTSYSVLVKQGSTTLGTVAAGAASDSVIPGVNVSVVTSPTFTNGVQGNVVVTAPVVQLNVIGVYSAANPNATYTTPVLDSGASGEQWPIFEATGQSTGPTPIVTLSAGEHPIPDSTWTTITLSGRVDADVSGNPWSRLTFATPAGSAPPIGRYAQLSGQIVSGVTWIGDAKLYHGNLGVDDLASRVAPKVYAGAVAAELLTAMSCLVALSQERARALLQSVSIGGAKAEYLWQYGQDFKTPRLINESDSGYRTRMAYFFRNRQDGGSAPFLQTTIAGSLGLPPSAVLVQPFPKGVISWVLGTSVLVVSTVLGQTGTGAWRWLIQVPVNKMQVPVETARAIIDQLRPIGTLVTLQFV